MLKNYYKYSDEELISLFAEKKQTSEKAFNVLYFRYHIRIFEYFFSRLNNRSDSEDLHQETFINFFKSSKKKTVINNVESYLFKIAKNIWIDHELKKYIGKRKFPKDDVDKKICFISLDEIENIESILNDKYEISFETKELIELIKWAIDQLDEKYKEPFIDRKELDMSIKQIAEKYKLSYEGAKKRVDRASGKIKDILGNYIRDIENSN